MKQLFQILAYKKVYYLLLAINLLCILLFIHPGTPMSSTDIHNITGHFPLDMQPFYTSLDIQSQLPLYTETALRKYLMFNLLDLIFPLFYGGLILSIVLRRFTASSGSWPWVVMFTLLVISADNMENYTLSKIIMPDNVPTLSTMK